MAHPVKPKFTYNKLCKIALAESIEISTEKIIDARALLKYLSPEGNKYYEDIFTNVPVKKSK